MTVKYPDGKVEVYNLYGRSYGRKRNQTRNLKSLRFFKKCAQTWTVQYPDDHGFTRGLLSAGGRLEYGEIVSPPYPSPEEERWQFQKWLKENPAADD